MYAIIADVTLEMEANAAINGFATWFTLPSSRSEGINGTTVLGRLLDESKM